MLHPEVEQHDGEGQPQTKGDDRHSHAVKPQRSLPLGIHRLRFPRHRVPADGAVVVGSGFLKLGGGRVDGPPHVGQFRAVALPGLQEDGGPDQVEDGKDGFAVHAAPGGDKVDDTDKGRRDERQRVQTQEGKVQGNFLPKVLLNFVCNTPHDKFPYC